MARKASGTSEVSNPSQSVPQYIIPNWLAISSWGATFTSDALPNRPCPYSTGLSSRWPPKAVLPTLQMNVA